MIRHVVRSVRSWWNWRAESRALRIERAVRESANLLLAQTRFAALGPDRVLEIERFGERLRFYLPKGYIDAGQVHLLLHETFLEEEELGFVMSRFLDARTHVVDVGANIGNHAIFFAKIAKVAHVRAFEPEPNNFRILSRNIELNDARIDAVPMAVGAEVGHCRLSGLPFNSGGTVALFGEGDIEVTTLDACKIERCDFLKVDVEGASCEVLEGGRDFLATHRPAILIEMHPPEFPKTSRLLAEHGYRMERSFEVNGQLVNFVYCR